MNTCNFVAKCAMLYKFRAFQRTFGSPQKLWKGCAFHSRGRIFPIVRLLTSKSAKQDSVFGSTERHWAVWKTGQSRSEHALKNKKTTITKTLILHVFLLKKRPYFARIFTKMSPSEELGTLPSQTEEMLWLLKNVSFCPGGAGRYREEALQELAAHCETQPPASIGWVAPSSLVCRLSRIVTSPLISTIRCFRP